MSDQDKSNQPKSVEIVDLNDDQTTENKDTQPVATNEKTTPQSNNETDNGDDSNDEQNNDNSKIGTIEETRFGKMKHISIVEEMEKSYLDYAMSVIVSRALPDVRDGLKPVHRRILFSMFKSGIHHNTSYKKSARIVGDVLGKYHPHGDAPVYGALVRLAQEFSMRYPLIDGQGNFGSIDGDSPAAMRYTEARLSKISQELLADINRGTVKFVDNFDGSLKEPVVLPTRLPNLLLTGSEGIAVGMATKIPPHNLIEISDAIIHMIEKGKSVRKEEIVFPPAVVKGKEKLTNPALIDKVLQTEDKLLSGKFESEITFEEIMEHINGPDFPTAGIIYDFNAIKLGYQTGKGRVVIRAKTSIEEFGKSYQIIVTELPYQVNKAKLLIKIADLVRNKKIQGIRNLRDDSDRQGLQVTIELKRDSIPKVVLNKLFKYSNLQTSFSMNMVALNSEGTPQLMNIRQILKEYIVHRQLVIVRRSQYKLSEARDRAHILEGLLIALDNLDEVIKIIRQSPDTPTAHKSLVAKFEFSDIQATAILDMQLKRLAALERQKIEDEYNEIKKTIDAIIALLTKPENILKVVVDETKEMIKLYGDKRRTKLIKGKVGEFSEEDLIANEVTVITLTDSGYIKRMNTTDLRSQSRGGKGSSGLKMKAQDMLKAIVSCETHDNLLFFTNKGRVFKMKAYEIPSAKRQAKGTAIVNLLNLKPQEKVQSILSLDEEKDAKKYITLMTRKGLVKKSAVKLYDNIRQNGIIAITLNKEDELVWGKVTTGQDDILLITFNGKSIRFSEKEIKSSQRDTKGVKGITLKRDDYVIGVEAFTPGEEEKKSALLIVTENGLGKRTLLKHYPVQKRSGLGVKVSEITTKTGKVAAAQLVNDSTREIVISTREGQTIKLPFSKKSIPSLTRPTQGVILMKLKRNDKVVAVAVTTDVVEKEKEK